jgi:HlyD family secretion protein
MSSPRALIVPRRPEQSDGAEVEQRWGAMVALIFFGGFLGWAALAPMDQGAYAPAKVVVAGRHQTVQHREGGVVAALFVKDGQQVAKDQVLIQLNGGEVEAQQRSLAMAVIGLKAQRARLLAEQLGGSIQWPAEFAALTGVDKAEAERAMRVQTGQFEARAATLSTQGGVFGQRKAQLEEEILGIQRQIASLDEQTRLIGEELAGIRLLYERGFAPITQVRALERQQAQLQGQRAAAAAQIASSRERIGETRLQNVEVDKAQQESIAKEIRDVEFQLNELTPKLQAAEEQLGRIQIRAPATGTVVGLTVHTVGGVIAPGQKILDVVPYRAPLVLEAMVSPNDADDLKVGQTSEVRFTGVQERGLPRLSGTITGISADSFTDETTRASYFTAEVTVPLSEVEKIRAQRPGFELKPGMPAQILAPLRKRTALQYLFEPLTDALWKSFREH